MYGGFGHQDSSGAHGRLNSLVSVRQAREKDPFEIVNTIVEGEALPGMLLGEQGYHFTCWSVQVFSTTP